jgi:hypothetical protein
VSKVFEERDDWKELHMKCRRARSIMVKAEHIETMYFKRPWIWVTFYRASKHFGLFEL